MGSEMCIRDRATLGPDAFAVINHGVPGYTTVEHLIQTAFYQTKFGVPPRCAIYYVGWNDLRNAYIPDLDDAYAKYHLPAQIDGLRVRRFGSAYASLSPLLTLTLRSIASWVDTAAPPKELPKEPQSGNDPALETIFVRNIRAISALNRSRGIRTIWIGQTLNAAEYDDDEIDGWIPLVRNRDVLPLLDRLNDLLGAEAARLGDAFIHLPDALFQPADFRDNGHFLPPGASKFAAAIAPTVAQLCR